MNVMRKRVMEEAGLAMRRGPSLKLISHILDLENDDMPDIFPDSRIIPRLHQSDQPSFDEKMLSKKVLLGQTMYLPG